MQLLGLTKIMVTPELEGCPQAFPGQFETQMASAKVPSAIKLSLYS